MKWTTWLTVFVIRRCINNCLYPYLLIGRRVVRDIAWPRWSHGRDGQTHWRWMTGVAWYIDRRKASNVARKCMYVIERPNRFKNEVPIFPYFSAQLMPFSILSAVNRDVFQPCSNHPTSTVDPALRSLHSSPALRPSPLIINNHCHLIGFYMKRANCEVA